MGLTLLNLQYPENLVSVIHQIQYTFYLVPGKKYNNRKSTFTQ